MTNLDSVLKSRDVTQPTKVCIIKDMVFPVVSPVVSHPVDVRAGQQKRLST